MSDWKSALKTLKREMFGVKSEVDSPAKRPKSDANSVVAKPRPNPIVTRSPSTKGSTSDSGRRHHKSNQASAKPKVPVQPVSPKSMGTSVPQPLKVQDAAQVQAPLAPPSPPKPREVPSTFQIQQNSNLTRQANFKIPDAWVRKGSCTQLPQQTKSAGAIDVFIGLDFGTSYTKAAVGLKDQIFVVDWYGVSASADRYLLPSEYSILADGSCQIGQAPDVSVDQVRQRLKHPLIDPAVSSASLANAAVFLALVLRYIRAWVFFHHGDKLGGSSIRWMLNIGAPSNGLENDRHQRAYLKMCSSAWSMSISELEPSAAWAVELIRGWQPGDLPTDLIGLDVLPEFVAQIAGYVQSAQRQRGLHALVDVGGGTLDVVTFIVHDRDGEDVFPFLVPEIRALGTQMLNQNRLVEAPEHEDSKLPDELQPVLSASEYAKSTGLLEDHIALRDNVFWREVHSTVHRVFQHTKRNRYRLSEAWTKGLPVFLTGGGGSVEGYQKSVKSGGLNCAPVMNLMLLPKHPKLADFSGTTSDYQRVSVACGLAQDAFSLGQLIPAGQVENDNNPVHCIADRPDRDELYAR
ncbi:hypothetical protein [Aquaspirillum soli]